MKTLGVMGKLGALAAIATTLAFAAAISGCKPESDKIQHGDAQRASMEDQAQQNRNLIDQVVNATEHQEKYPDSAFLRGALSRLSPWLTNREQSPDFESDPEYEQIVADCEALAATAKRADELVNLFLGDKPTAQESDCAELQQTLEKAKAQLEPLATQLRSDALALFVQFCAEFAEKLAGAREFQFADATETFANQIKQIAQEPAYQFYNFATLNEGLVDFARLCKLDEKIFLPQDADFLRAQIWFRDVFSWAKGKKQDDMEIVKKLFDWTVKNVVLANPTPGPAGAIAQLEWQTLLLGEGSAMDRAIVFIELLRQHRLDAFILRPENYDPNAERAFPLIVGVVLNGSDVYLFSPELALPFASAEPDAIELAPELVYHKIATLKQVADDDSILRKFDLPDAPYNASAADFQKMVAYVPSTPFLTSARMLPLEEEFSGHANTVLATPFQAQRDRILEMDNIVDVKRLHEATAPILEHILFPVETEALTRVYMLPLDSSSNGNLEVSSSTDKGAEATDVKAYGDTTDFSGEASGAKKALIAPLWIGKILYLRGQFLDENGAATWFSQSRTSERALRQLEASIPKLVAEDQKNYLEHLASQQVEYTREDLQQRATETAVAYQMEIAAKRYVKVITSYYLALLSDASCERLKDDLTQLESEGADQRRIDAAKAAVETAENALIKRLDDESLRLTRAHDEALGEEFRLAAQYLRARALEAQNETRAAVARFRACAEPGAKQRAALMEELAGIAQEENVPPTESGDNEANEASEASEPLETSEPPTSEAPVAEEQPVSEPTPDDVKASEDAAPAIEETSAAPADEEPQE